MLSDMSDVKSQGNVPNNASGTTTRKTDQFPIVAVMITLRKNFQLNVNLA